MRKSIFLAVAMNVALLAGPSVAADLVTWKLKDRFRLFDQAASVEARARVESLLDAMHASAVEGGSAEGDIIRHYDQILTTLTRDNGKELRRSNWKWAETTEDRALRRYLPSYVYPERYWIDARLTDPAGWTGTCRWSADGEVLAAGPCTDSAVLRLDAGPLGGGWGAEATLTVTDTAGRTGSQALRVEDRLVVAMGDSFISGEGNPDTPSKFAEGVAPGPQFQRADWPRFAPGVEDLFTKAEWWDEPCHRSLLSWPTLASIYEASRDEHRAITFLHFGCSGAEANDGIYGPQEDLPGGGDEAESQVDQLRALLSANPAGRRVDKVLLSIGGNDVGFVPVIEYVMAPPNFGWGPFDAVAAAVIGRPWERNKGPVRPYESDGLPLGPLGGFRTPAQKRLRSLPAEYDQVAAKFGELAIDPRDVTQAAYPDLLSASDGQLCRTVLNSVDLDWWKRKDLDQWQRESDYAKGRAGDERAGFEALLVEVPPFVPRLRNVWNFQVQFTPDADRTVDGPVCTSAANPGDSEVCKAHWVWSELNEAVRTNQSRGWVIVDSHIEKTKGHGWCESPVDTLAMPRAVSDGGQPLQWSPEPPHVFDPYRADLGRWVRTANDAFRTQYGGPERAVGGTFHPTFNAHLRYAEAVADKAFPEGW